MLKPIIRFIHNLRVVFFVFIVVAFFAYLGLNPINVGQYFGAQVGSAVGMSVDIPENPFNKLALQLKEKEERLDQREKELEQREQELTASGGTDNQTAFFIASGIMVLFFLLLANFYMDWRRGLTKGQKQ